MKMSLREITCSRTTVSECDANATGAELVEAYILVLEMLEQLELTIRSFGEYGRAEGLHYLFNGDILVRKLVASGTAWAGSAQKGCGASEGKSMERRGTYQTRPKAPMPTGWRSEYLAKRQHGKKFARDKARQGDKATSK